MAVTRKQKEEMLAELINNFEKAKSVMFTQYKGIKVKDMRSLRKKLHEQKVTLKIAKKTLISLAAKKNGYDQIPDDFLSGPIALAFSGGDEIAPAKIIHEFGKTNENVKITGAIFEGKLISAAEAQAIAVLPSREVLLGKLVGLLKSPISGFHGILHSLLRNFVYALSEVHKKKSPGPSHGGAAAQTT